MDPGGVKSGSTENFIGGFVDDILSEISLNNEKKSKKKPLKESNHRPLSKLELYKSRQFYCREPHLSIADNSEDELISCPLCLLLIKKSEYSKHVKRSERHSSYLQIEDLYLTYCDRRRINPVSCHVKELESFIQRLAWRPEENILPVWIYLSSRHEADLTSFDVVRAVLESPLRNRRSHQICPNEEFMPTSYACYSCPYFCRTARDLFSHIHGEEHARSIKAWSLRGGDSYSTDFSIFTNLFCDYCDEEFRDEASLRLHRFGRKHLGGGRMKIDEGRPCVLCETDKDIDLRKHISEVDHKEKETMAEGFLIFCYQNGLEIPLDISPESLIRYLETFPPSSLSSNVKLLRRLFGSDEIPSCPFNHKKVKIFISYTELSGSVYSPELPNKTIDLLTRCSFEKETCSDMRFERITRLLYHSVGIHGLSPSDVLRELFLKIDNEESWCDKKPKTCKDCPNKSFTSPVLYALHNDAHLGTSVECESCKKEYKSPVLFYYNDSCGANDIPQAAKDLVDQMIKTILLTCEMGVPYRVESNPDFPSSTLKKRKRTEEEEGLVGNWLLNCPTVRARKISVASRKRVEGDDSDQSDNSVRSSKIVLDGSPQILPEIEDEKEVNGNIRKRPKLNQSNRGVEKTLRKRLSDRILHPVLKSQWSVNNNGEVKAPKNSSDVNVRSCRNPHIPPDNVNKKINVIEKKTTPKTLSKFAPLRISPALLPPSGSSNLPRHTNKSKLNASKSLFKKDPLPISKIRSPTSSKLELKPGGGGGLPPKTKICQPLKSRKSDLPMKIRSFMDKKKPEEAKENKSPSSKLNKTITMTTDTSSSESPSMNRTSTFIRIDDEPQGDFDPQPPTTTPLILNPPIKIWSKGKKHL